MVPVGQVWDLGSSVTTRAPTHEIPAKSYIDEDCHTAATIDCWPRFRDWSLTLLHPRIGFGDDRGLRPELEAEGLRCGRMPIALGKRRESPLMNLKLVNDRQYTFKSMKRRTFHDSIARLGIEISYVRCMCEGSADISAIIPLRTFESPD